MLYVSGHYCTCHVTANNSGTCAHVASILWYLGYAYHEAHVKYANGSTLHTSIDVTHRAGQEDLVFNVGFIIKTLEHVKGKRTYVTQSPQNMRFTIHHIHHRRCPKPLKVTSPLLPTTIVPSRFSNPFPRYQVSV